MKKIFMSGLLCLISASSFALTSEQMDMVEILMNGKDYESSHENDAHGDLEEGESKSFFWGFTKGRYYTLAAVCDDDCDDVDLSVFDRYGNEVDTDDDTKDLALVSFKAVYSGDYKIRVSIYGCSTSTCYYRVRSFRKQ